MTHDMVLIPHSTQTGAGQPCEHDLPEQAATEKLRKPRKRKQREKLFVYQSTLSRVYGLTPTMIAELGGPDEYCPNPNWRTGPYPAYLYRIDRVEAWIAANQERVDKARASRVKRSAAMKAVQERKHAERVREAERRRAKRLCQAEIWLNEVEITVQQPFASTLLTDAQKHYPFAGYPDPLQEKALRAYVRHQLTNYDLLRWKLKCEILAPELYPRLRERIDAAVENALVAWQKSQRAA